MLISRLYSRLSCLPQPHTSWYLLAAPPRLMFPRPARLIGVIRIYAGEFCFHFMQGTLHMFPTQKLVLLCYHFPETISCSRRGTSFTRCLCPQFALRKYQFVCIITQLTILLGACYFGTFEDKWGQYSFKQSCCVGIIGYAWAVHLYTGQLQANFGHCCIHKDQHESVVQSIQLSPNLKIPDAARLSPKMCLFVCFYLSWGWCRYENCNHRALVAKNWSVSCFVHWQYLG